ncbi:MAG TPA: copper resistance CopC family protein [Verrucomicrobiae bacterium]|jgi:hypothetical protein|nr:copper resistance CopC family protein [Verrucomicrobiae bacterium]
MKHFEKAGSLQRWVITLFLFAIWQAPAWAHAFLDHAEPRVGSAVAQSPGEIKIWFTQNIEAAFSSMEVRDAQGKQVDKKDSHLDPQSKSLLLVSVPALAPGTYTVAWHVISVDTHKTQGHFEFTVRPGQK